MASTSQDPRVIAAQFMWPVGIVSEFGSGKDGTVFKTARRTAVKVHQYPKRFRQELAVYLRLQDEKVASIAGAAVPELINHSVEQLALEITTVRPPFVIDFATSQLDVPPDFSPEVWEEFRIARAEEFGEQWPWAARIFDELQRRYGIWHLDLSPRNVDLGSKH